MASSAAVVGLRDVLAQAEVPTLLMDYISDVWLIKRLEDFLCYVVKSSYEQEWCDVVKAAFPVVAAREASEGQPAVEAFTDPMQRIWISKLRAAYAVALRSFDAVEDATQKAKDDKMETDMEKPLDPEVERQLIEGWRRFHDWEPTKSMKAAPKFKNRVCREFVRQRSPIIQSRKL